MRAYFSLREVEVFSLELSCHRNHITAVVESQMKVSSITPILNVSSIQETFEWFSTLGWKKGFEWGDPVGFGSVCTGDVEIFLCQDGQGGRGKGTNKTTFGDEAIERSDQGVWMSLWVDDVDLVHEACLKAGIDVTFPPTDMPWNVREMHIRHPDGHVFRVGRGF